MRPNEFDFDLEDIIKEFDNYVPEQPPRRRRSAPKTEKPAPPVTESVPEEPTPAPVPEEIAYPKPEHMAPEAEELSPAEKEPIIPEEPEAEKVPEEAPIQAEEAPVPEEQTEPEKKRKKKKKKTAKADAEEAAEEPKPKKKKDQPKKLSVGARIGLGVLSLIFAAISLVCLGWSLENIHPETTTVEAAKASASTNLVARLTTSVYNSKADALSTIAYIPKQYTIPEDQRVAPLPDESCFGTVSIAEADKVMEVIQKARDSGLLDGQEVLFNPNLNFYYDSNIRYYCDDTILTICWKELIDGFTVSCCEVKVADASQFRRKITEDTFGSPQQVYASELARGVNAVVAMNADFYMFRDFGIMVYDRKLYRMDDSTYTGMYKKYNCVDTCFVDENGNFKFFHRLEEMSWADMEQYIKDNNILFSISFGPVLVENGQVQVCDWYPAGEIDRGYSRAGIGQLDDLHYFYMSLNHSNEKAARWTVNQFAQEIARKGVKNAYCFDGGQTSEIVFKGEPYNYIDFGAERKVSDIIYFATAIPESEVTQ